MSKFRQQAIDSMIEDMISMYPDDPHVIQAREELRAREPDAVENIEPYDPNLKANIFQHIEPLRDKSPFTPEYLLQTEPSTIIRRILDFKETKWGVENRDGLVSALCSVAGQSTDWAFKLFAALLDQEVKDNDIWQRVFWKLKWEKLSVDQKHWLLDHFDASFTYSEEYLSGFADLVIGHGIPAGKESPDPKILQKQLQLSFDLWAITHNRAGWKVERPYSENDWIFEAINRPPGHCCVFWLKYTELQQKEATDAKRTWSAKIEPYMNQIVTAETRGQLLGLALLGQFLSAVRYMAPEWTKANLYPCLDFATRGDKAFPLWLGFSGYGWLSRELAVELPPYFVSAFSRIKEFKESLADRFTGIVAAVAISGLWDVHHDDWLKKFLTSIDANLRRKWLTNLARLLRGSLPEEKKAAWNDWLREYWEKRLSGLPHPLESSETERFYNLALSLGPVADEAVPLLRRLPRTQVEWSHVFLGFDKSTLRADQGDVRGNLAIHLAAELLDARFSGATPCRAGT
jgi:hypothetical protein